MLLASLVVAVAPAAAEAPDSAPTRSVSEGGLSIGEITGPESPEEFPLTYGNLSPEMRMRQVSEQLVVAEYIEGGVIGWLIEAPPEHDAVGSTVPTSVRLSEGNVVTLIVHHRAGNPAAGWAPFVYPITEGKGWEGGLFSGEDLFGEAEAPVGAANPPAPTAPMCKVPSLRGYSLRVAKNRLRAARCGVGAVRLAVGATAGKGKVVKQFRAAGSELAAGAPVAVELGAGR